MTWLFFLHTLLMCNQGLSDENQSSSHGLEPPSHSFGILEKRHVLGLDSRPDNDVWLHCKFIYSINTRNAFSALLLSCYAMSPLAGPCRSSTTHRISFLICGSEAGRGLTGKDCFFSKLVNRKRKKTRRKDLQFFTVLHKCHWYQLYFTAVTKITISEVNTKKSKYLFNSPYIVLQ